MHTPIVVALAVTHISAWLMGRSSARNANRRASQWLGGKK